MNWELGIGNWELGAAGGFAADLSSGGPAGKAVRGVRGKSANREIGVPRGVPGAGAWFLAVLVFCVLLGGCGALGRQGAEVLDPLGREMFALPGESTLRMDSVTVHVFENGLTMLHEERRSNATVALTAVVGGGSAMEPDDKAGLTGLMMSSLPKGTSERSADEIAEHLAGLGASLQPGSSMDYSLLSLHCLAKDLGEALPVFADVLLNPNFPVDEVEIERRKLLAAIRMNEDYTPAVAMRRFRQELFGSHPYGRDPMGTAETVGALETWDLYTQHRGLFVPSNMVVGVVGNISFAEARDLVRRNLGAPGPERHSVYQVDKVIAPGPSRAEVPRPSTQGFVVMGHLTAPVGDEDSAAVQVAATILGSGMSSRLFRELRDREGLAYAVAAANQSYRRKGMLAAYIGTAGENLERAEERLWGQIRLLRETPVTQEELERAKNSLRGSYLRSKERNARRARMLAVNYQMELGPDYMDRLQEEIQAVTSREVMRVANKYFLEPTTVIIRPQAAAAPAE